MLKKLIELYKIPLLVSLTLSVVLTALKLERNPVSLTLIFLGTFSGTFLLDLDYIIYAYFLEPTADFSQTLRGFIRHADLGNAISYIYYQKESVKDKTLNSALFQVVLAGLSLFVVSSTVNYFVKTLIISTFVNSLYRLLEYYFKDKSNAWFWILKTKPNKHAIYTYTAALLVILYICLRLY